MMIHIKRIGTCTSDEGTSAYAVTGDNRQVSIPARTADALIRSARVAGAPVRFRSHGPHSTWYLNGDDGVQFIPAVTVAVPA